MTAEQRRDDAVAAILAAGGQITGTEPLATVDDPHTVVAYRIHAGAPDVETLARVLAVQDATERDDIEGLIPWTPQTADSEVMES